MVGLVRASGKSIGQIAKELDLTELTVRAWVRQAAIDERRDPQTTVSRSLVALVRRGWMRVARGRDRRERRVTLSAEGERELQGVEHAWRRAQARLRRHFGAEEWRSLQRS